MTMNERKFTLFLLFLCLLMPAFLHAQSTRHQVTGTITDKSGRILPGVTVTIKNSNTRAATNTLGVYTITINDPQNDILVYTFIGFKTVEERVSSRARINLQLEDSNNDLQEVVVTALGFEASKDKLGYTSAKVKGDQIASSGEVSLVDGLGGKASGVRISRSSGSDPGAASQILIRGQSTITRSTDPLIVLDGMPIEGSSRGEGSSGTTAQNRLSDINPDDIASVQILKGASAAALWGTKAANGVIQITTKKGGGDRTVISFKSTYSVDRVSQFYDLQNTYGQGSGGVFAINGTRSWGDKIANRSGAADGTDPNGPYFIDLATGKRFDNITQKNSQQTFVQENYDQIFGTGTYWDNNLSVSSGNAKSNYFFSLGDLKQDGVIRNSSDYRRTSIRFNATKEMNKWLSITNSFNFSRIGSSRVQRGVNNAGLLIGLLRTPPDFDNSGAIGNYFSGAGAAFIPNRQRTYRNYVGASANPGFNNPQWVINQMSNTDLVNRFINSSELNITAADWLKFTLRGGLDSFNDREINYFPYYTANANTGQYNRGEFNQLQLNLDAIGRANKKFSDNFSANMTVGYNYNSLNTSNIGGQTINFIIPDGPRSFSNATPSNTSTFSTFNNSKTNAGYASVGLDLYNQVFVNANGRLEAASTFGVTNAAFFYPSADIAWQFTEMSALKENAILSFGKLRASFGIVGIQPQAYRTATNYTSSTIGDVLNPYLDPNLYSTGSYLQSNSKGNPALKPERKQEFELGTDLRFFNNSFQVGFTYYQNKTTDALINIPQAASTGFNFIYANAGAIQNKGVEVDLSYNFPVVKDWNFSVDANWTRNRNKVLNLNGAGSVNLGGTAGVSSRAVEGYALGELYSIAYNRNASGNYALDANGFPVPGVTSTVIGDPNPDWRGGFGFHIKYKNFSLNTLLEHSQGGVVVDGTEAVLLDYGTSGTTGQERVSTTALKRYDGTTIPANTPFRGNIQDFGSGPVALEQSWYTGPGGWFGNVGEAFIKNATWTRVREITIAYNFNPSKLLKINAIKTITLEASGRNLFLWSKVKGFDPDTNVGGSGSARGVVYFDNPATR
ncbi:MAG: SusC/RagA family TonB-linked outer membrane protein, partial [Pedobacter sp.]